jgi:hypothetical protein
VLEILVKLLVDTPAATANMAFDRQERLARRTGSLRNLSCSALTAEFRPIAAAHTTAAMTMNATQPRLSRRAGEVLVIVEMVEGFIVVIPPPSPRRRRARRFFDKEVIHHVAHEQDQEERRQQHHHAGELVGEPFAPLLADVRVEDACPPTRSTLQPMAIGTALKAMMSFCHSGRLLRNATAAATLMNVMSDRSPAHASATSSARSVRRMPIGSNWAMKSSFPARSNRCQPAAG